uniref:Uncharacterized protein n=1 Tax=Populus alba TaxID=43335 RepID=A0A4U5PNE7_POPAL|nr:hypothetical protein D5086_0000205290 [Populus alba]
MIPATVPVTRAKPLGGVGSCLSAAAGAQRTLICKRSCQPIGSHQTRPTAWRDVTIPANRVPVTRSKPFGRVGAAYPRLRACARSTLICQRSCQPIGKPQRAQRLGAMSRFRPPSPGPAPKPLGRVGAAYPRRGRGALTSRARSKVLAADARLSACRERPGGGGRNPCPSPAPSRWERGWGTAYPRSRAWGLNRIPLVPRCWQPQRRPTAWRYDSPRAKVLASPNAPNGLAATSRQRWPLPVLASWRPGRRVWCGPPSFGDCEESCTAWACRIQLPALVPKVLALVAIPKLLRDVARCEAWPPSSELRQMAPNDCPLLLPPAALSLRDPLRPPRLVACPFEIPPRPAACCLSLRDPFASPSGVLLVPSRSFRVQRCGHDSLSGCFPLALVACGSLVGIVVRVYAESHERYWAVRVGRLRACAPELSACCPHHSQPKALGALRARAGFLCCVTHFGGILNVKLSLSAARPPRGRRGEPSSGARVPVRAESPNWPNARVGSCFRMRNAMPARGPPPCRPSRSSRSCSIRTTSSPSRPLVSSASGIVRVVVSPRNATWLILPVVICLSQRLSHACVSMN